MHVGVFFVLRLIDPRTLAWRAERVGCGNLWRSTSQMTFRRRCLRGRTFPCVRCPPRAAPKISWVSTCASSWVSAPGTGHRSMASHTQRRRRCVTRTIPTSVVCTIPVHSSRPCVNVVRCKRLQGYGRCPWTGVTGHPSTRTSAKSWRRRGAKDSGRSSCRWARKTGATPSIFEPACS